MLGRALSLATVMLLVGFAEVPAQAQNLEAGKSASQIFAGSCTVCHKSPRGLLKTVAPGALPGFLRQHYTTSSDMASSLSAYVISNGATDTRAGSPRPAAAAPAATAPADSGFSFFGLGRKPAAPEAAAPEPVPEPVTRRGRNAKRLRSNPEAEQVAKPADGDAPVAEAKHGQKQKPGKKVRRTRDESVKPDTAKDEPKAEPAKPEVAKPAEESKPAAAKPETPRSEPAPARADPVPAVTPAPKASESVPKPESPASSETAPASKPAE